MTDTALTAAVNNLPTDLNLLTTQIKFYINQWGQNTIEIGKRLIAAKELVGHGNFGKWLEDNFNLKERSAQNFMAVAEKFGKTQASADLSFYQMVTMLVLPEGEIEKFIAEKTAEGKPVEDMTVKQLRAEVAEYKAKLEKKNSEVTDLFAENKKLQEDKKSYPAEIAGLKENQFETLFNAAGY